MCKGIGIVAAVLFSTQVFAAGIDTTNVVRLMMDYSYGDILFIDTADHQLSPEECHTNGSWEYVLDISTQQGEHIYSMLLTAKASDAEVHLAGTSNCALFGGIETLKRIELK